MHSLPPSRIPNLLRRLFGEGSLSIAFVPVFTETMAKGTREDGLRLAASSLKFLLICLTVVAVVGVVIAPTLIHLVAPGFSHITGKNGPDGDPDPHHVPLRDPYRVGGPVHGYPQCLGALCGPGHRTGAVEPGHDRCRFFSVSWFSDSQTVRVMGLAGGVLLGGLLQLALQVPYLVKHGVRFWQSSGLWHPGMKNGRHPHAAHHFRCGGLSDQYPGGDPAGLPAPRRQRFLSLLC